MPDRGLDYGDGLFETLLLRRGDPLHLPLHLERLGRGLQRLAFPDCVTLARQRLEQACTAAPVRAAAWSALRLSVSRGRGARGYAPPECPTPRVVVSVATLHRDCAEMAAPAKLGIARMRWGDQPALAGIKHLNRLEQVMAAHEARLLGMDDMLMLDQSGRVVSTTAGNLFALRDGAVHTPALERCGIGGTRRQLLLRDWAPALGLPVVEGPLSLDEVRAADEVFYSNSLWGLRPVGRLGERELSQHTLCSALFALWLESAA